MSTNRKNIVLIGMMGCGKSSVGRLLSRRLGRELMDTDAYITALEGRTVREIFDQEGERYFRVREMEACVELSRRESLVIACGGGTALQQPGMEALRRSGVIFWLDRDPAETYDALDIEGRPLAREGREAFVARYEKRAPVYRARADYVIDRPQSAQAAADAILCILKEEQPL